MAEDDLEIPAFLRRTGPSQAVQIKEEREWAPIRTERQKVKPAIFADKPELPVRVVTKTDQDLTTLFEYPDFKTFYERHRFDDYPLKRMASIGNKTIVLVTETHWVKRADRAPEGKLIRMSTKDRVYDYADEMWILAGKPMDKKLILQMRKQWMIDLEKEGINKLTCSSELGQWMKTKNLP